MSVIVRATVGAVIAPVLSPLGCALPWESDGAAVAQIPRGDVSSWRGGDVSLITMDGSSRVSQVLSYVGDGILSAAGAQRPLYIASEPIFGGQACFYLDGSGIYFDVSGTTRDLASGSIVIVGSEDTVGGNRPFFSDLHISTGGILSAQSYINATPTWGWLDNGGAPTTLFATASTPVAATGYVLTASWGPGRRAVCVNADPVTIESTRAAANVRRLPRGYVGQGSGPAYLNKGKIASIDIYSYAVI